MRDDLIKPRCVHGGRDPAFNVRGYFLPCCWCDNTSSIKEFEYLGFFEEDLHIDSQNTADDIRSIFTSPEWEHFYHLVRYDQSNAPATCHHHCGIFNGRQAKVTEKVDSAGIKKGVDDGGMEGNKIKMINVI